MQRDNKILLSNFRFVDDSSLRQGGEDEKGDKNMDAQDIYRIKMTEEDEKFGYWVGEVTLRFLS